MNSYEEAARILSNVVYDYRKSNDLTQEELQKRSGVSKSQISYIEREINPDTGEVFVAKIDTIVKLSNAMNIDTFDLLNSMYGFIPHDIEVLSKEIQKLPPDDYKLVYALIQRLKLNQK